MRRIKQQLSTEESVNILKNQKRGFLAVNGDDNYPYIIPLNYVFIDDKIYFHTAKEGHFKDALKKNNKVSFSVIDNGRKVENEWYYIFKSVIVFGKISFINDLEDKKDILTILGNKYFPSEEYTHKEIEKHLGHVQVLKLTIEHMTCKKVTER